MYCIIEISVLMRLSWLSFRDCFLITFTAYCFPVFESTPLYTCDVAPSPISSTNYS